ncbi:MAG: error-prone DNA polymerase [Burkholderiaceae bacterium]
MPDTHEKPRWTEEEEELPPVLADAVADGGQDSLPQYAELHCLTNFSFQRGASHPQELVRRAYNLGYQGLAITDECSVAGVVRAFAGLRRYREFIAELSAKLPGRRSRAFTLLYGSEFDMGDCRLVAIARDLKGWGGLCEFITRARTGEAKKGSYEVGWEKSNLALLGGCEIILVPRRFVDEGGRAALEDRLRRAKALFGASLWLGAELTHRIDDDLWILLLREAGVKAGVPLVAAGNVRMHRRSRKPLHDVLTAVRLGRTVRACGQELEVNAQRSLRSRLELGKLYPDDVRLATLEVMKRCSFDLTEIQYDYPLEAVPKGMTPTEGLRHLTIQGALKRYPEGIPFRVRRLMLKELKLIAFCRYEMFFLTVHDIVREARERKILCQGRGSAANSVVCFCLGVTAMDPMIARPLLERFISKDRRNEPPDIDVDFEHERREEIIQYIYRKYTRERAAIAAVVIAYRTRSAIRDVGKALGIEEALIDAFASEHHWFDDELAVQKLGELAQRVGVEMEAHRALQWIELTESLMGFPRHLSQHVGGFVLTQTPLVNLVPIEKASMADRSVIQWDKDDLEEMGLMKVDVLALGMLTALRRCLDFRNAIRPGEWELASVPNEDPATFEMIRRADTVGVFQIESRAQMSMLPRLKPREFYDLVVEVAIVRPGPITGGMVHPYLKARDRQAAGLPIEYELSTVHDTDVGKLPDRKPRLAKALDRTLGIPIFQEQVMEISMLAAGFTATQADGLRRAMAAWKRKGGVDKYRDMLISGMLKNGYTPDFAERIFKQILGFGDYGFPESHAYSFALLAYSSSYLKCHEPACFLAAMLNSQPMGFYNPSQLIQDARRSGLEVRPADVSHSNYDCTLELRAGETHPAVRLGLRLVGSLSEMGARRVEDSRTLEGAFRNAEELSLRAQLDVKDLNALAAADALASIAGHRRQQVWEAAARHKAPELLRRAPVDEAPLALPQAPEGEEIFFDYSSMNLTLRRHPLALLRPRLARMRYLNSSQLAALPSGRSVAACGIVTVRQQPQTANGTIFVTLEDETGPVNVIVWKHVREAQRDALMRARLLAVHGRWQRDDETGGLVRNLIAERLTDLTPLLGRLGQQSNRSRDFH